MSYTINIGLNNPFTKGVNSVDQTIKAALGAVADVTNIRVSYDSDEPTAVSYTHLTLPTIYAV